jgi:hypothetical protein
MARYSDLCEILGKERWNMGLFLMEFNNARNPEVSILI